MHIYPCAYTHACLYVDTHVCVYIHIYLYIIFHSGQRSPFCNRMILFDTKNCQDDNQSCDLFSYTSTFKWKESHLLLLRKWFCFKNSVVLMYCWIFSQEFFHHGSCTFVIFESSSSHLGVILSPRLKNSVYTQSPNLNITTAFPSLKTEPTLITRKIPPDIQPKVYWHADALQCQNHL